MRKGIIGLMFALLVSIGLTGASARPTMAAETSCTMIYTDYVCTSGILSANPKYHALYAEGSAWSAGRINCWVHDAANWVIVARLTSTYHTATQKIRGLYGTYFIGCAQGSSNWGSGDGLISNDDWRFH
jgi:hypothetical protein